jgi:outer membrane beta-barrel protein
VETLSRGLAAIAVGLVVCLVCAPAAHAQGLPSEAELPSCLDQTIKGELGAQLTPRGVQKRNFIKDGKLALDLRGGMFGGDLTSSAWIAGGSLTFWFTEDFGLEASFDVTPIQLELDEPLAEFFGDDRFVPGLGYLALANVAWSPIHAKLKAGGGIIHTDVLFYAGGGRMFHDSVQGVTLDGGIALDLFITKLVTFRFDIKDVMMVQEAVAETRFTNNLVATAGLTFWIPTPL